MLMYTKLNEWGFYKVLGFAEQVGLTIRYFNGYQKFAYEEFSDREFVISVTAVTEEQIRFLERFGFSPA